MTSRSDVLPTLQPTPAPQVTLTIRQQTTVTPSPTRASGVRVAVQTSPVPTVTPEIYIVRENDTLLDIALRVGIDLQALRAANPDINPEMLQIGQPLVIPSAATPQQPILTPAERPNLTLLPPQCIETISSSILCLGRVLNETDMPVGRVSILVQLLGEDETTLMEQIAAVEQQVIPPGGDAPFRVLFPDSSLENVQQVVTALEDATVVEIELIPLTIESSESERDGTQYTVRGTLFNSTGRTTQAPRAVITVLSDELKVIAYRIWQAQAPLPPGTRIEFQTSMLLVGPYANLDNLTHQIHVEARASE